MSRGTRREDGAAALALLAAVTLALLSVSAHAAREGDAAPAFQLPDTMEELVSLEDYAGDPVVLVFYRGFF